jgi:hypothetical protein
LKYPISSSVPRRRSGTQQLPDPLPAAVHGDFGEQVSWHLSWTPAQPLRKSLNRKILPNLQDRRDRNSVKKNGEGVTPQQPVFTFIFPSVTEISDQTAYCDALTEKLRGQGLPK